MAGTLDTARIDAALAGLPGWTREGDAIEKVYTATSYGDAVALVTRLAFAAEAADHHPDLRLEYRRVTVRFWTNSAGGVTQKDLDGAATAERLASPFVTSDQ